MTHIVRLRCYICIRCWRSPSGIFKKSMWPRSKEVGPALLYMHLLEIAAMMKPRQFQPGSGGQRKQKAFELFYVSEYIYVHFLYFVGCTVKKYKDSVKNIKKNPTKQERIQGLYESGHQESIASSCEVCGLTVFSGDAVDVMEGAAAAGKRIKGLPAGGAVDDKDHVTKSEMKKSAKVRVCLFVCLSVCVQSEENRRRRGQNSRERQRPFNLPGNCN